MNLVTDKKETTMRIAISTDDSNGLDSQISAHFGRCPYFTLVDVEGQEVKDVRAVDNPYYGNHTPGQVPGFIHSHSAHVMLAGGMGRRAVSFFQEYGIQAVTGASGTVRQALQGYLGGELRDAEPCAESHEHHHCNE
jgi:predicted Fe-Mo cluster-binding NifX family protein